MLEEWKAVSGKCAGYLYEVSNLGRVRSHCKGWRNGRLVRPFHDKDKYHRVNLYNGKIMIQVTIHSLVMESFIGPRPDGMTINHLDFNKENNSLDNLEWLTTQENTHHAKIAGRMKLSRRKLVRR